MGSLFDLPKSRSSRGADLRTVSKVTSKKSASTVIRGGGILERISSINALVSSKLGKYKDEYSYFMAEDEQKFKDYIYNIIQNGFCALDTETTGLDPMQDKIVGMSLYSKGQKGLYIPLNHKSYITGVEVEGQLDKRIVAEQLKRLVDAGVKVKEYNAKFDTRVIKQNLGIYVPCWFDAHLAAMCLNENEPHGLKTLHSKYILKGKEDEFSFGQLFSGITFDLVPIKTGYIYAARDAVDTDELVDFQLPYLTPGTTQCESQGLEEVSKVFWNIEMPCIPALMEMEDNGIAFDLDYAQKLSDKYHKELDEKLNNFYKALEQYKPKIDSYRIKNPDNKLDEPISVSSPIQLAILLYDILEVKPVDAKKPRGTGVEILEKIGGPLCKAILEYRTVEKLLSTYVDKLPNCINPKTGRIHPNYNQYGAKTGRMSSDDPNLQNIPSHNKDIRLMFTASEGNVLLSSDYSQQEPKVMTQMCKDPAMIDAYKNEKDLYASIASLAFNRPYEDCLEFTPDGKTNPEGKERRTHAKSVLLGILYGRGINSVAEQLNVSKSKAQQIQNTIFKGFPAIKKFEDDTIDMAITNGYVTTNWGRKRRLPEMQLPDFEFSWMEGFGDVDPLSFDLDTVETEVPIDKVEYYTHKLNKNPFRKRAVFEEARSEGILIKDNTLKIADATRQCVNSRIQGSAADLTKLAAIELNNCKELRDLGFKLLVPVHDEFIAECPYENRKRCAELFSKCMADAARDMDIPISTDVECSREWYGKSISLED